MLAAVLSLAERGREGSCWLQFSHWQREEEREAVLAAVLSLAQRRREGSCAD